MLRGGSASGLSIYAFSMCMPALSAADAALEIKADPPGEVAVTVYKSPSRSSGSIDLNHLNGFALVSESRLVRLPAGLSRLRFEGVADGIEAQSAIVTGLPQNIIEKNRDAKVLSPTALLEAAAGKAVELSRTERKTGTTVREPGTILSDASGGVVFSTAAGIEALRCSGLPETFNFEPAGLPAARPSLSVLIRAPAAVAANVTLSYLSRGFDWSADYSATLSGDERTMDLGAWVTLANSNGAAFPSARTQVVAGRVNHEEDASMPADLGGPILALCWPRGSTSDSPPRALRFAGPEERSIPMALLAAAPALAQTALRQYKATEEQLGDLKLYRVPEPTSLASRESKQVRLLDRAAIPVLVLYRAELSADEAQTSVQAKRVLRTTNDKANHLGLPLPSGSVAVYSVRDGVRLLLHQASLRDVAVNEEVEIDLGAAAEVQVAVSHERTAARERAEGVQITNARPQPIRMELPVTLQDGARMIRADHPLNQKNARPTFQVIVPADGSAHLRYWVRDPSPQMPR